MTSIQLKLAAGVAALVMLVVLVAGSVAERGLRARETARNEASLRERAELVRELVGETPLRVSERARLQPLVVRAARAAGARITLIAVDGSVVADSDVVLAELPAVENHADRPEVRAALDGLPSTDRRRSRTLKRPFLYLGIPAAKGGVVRLARDVEAVESQVAELRRELLLAGGLALAVASVLAILLTGRALRPVRELRNVVSSLAGGDLDRRLPWHSEDELGEIADSVNRVGDQLRRRIRDVTAEKEQLQAVLEGMVEGVLVIDPEDSVVVANPRFRELFGAWVEVVGRRHWEVVRRPEVEKALRQASESGEAVVLEFALTEPVGHVLQMHAVRFPKRGALRGIVAVFHDVTELRRLEGVRRDFVANVSHELKTPLTAIRGFAETLLANDLGAEQRHQYLQVIVRHAERLGRLIEDVLDLSRIESRKLALEPAPVDVARVTSVLLREMAPQFASRQLEAELEASGEAVAWADRQALEQVLANLLDNAAKYTEPGGRIRLRIAQGADEVRVEVEDTGIGIPRAELSRIFERFYRVNTARSRDLGGTGLGLAIVKHLVQSLGGEVFATSEPGRGSIFTVKLPRHKTG